MKNVRNIGCPSPFFILRSQFSVDALVNPRNLNLMLMGGLRFAPPILRLVTCPYAIRSFNALGDDLVVDDARDIS